MSAIRWANCTFEFESMNLSVLGLPTKYPCNFHNKEYNHANVWIFQGMKGNKHTYTNVWCDITLNFMLGAWPPWLTPVHSRKNLSSIILKSRMFKKFQGTKKIDYQLKSIPWSMEQLFLSNHLPLHKKEPWGIQDVQQTTASDPENQCSKLDATVRALELILSGSCKERKGSEDAQYHKRLYPKTTRAN